jgi:hypothetical protein
MTIPKISRKACRISVGLLINITAVAIIIQSALH